MPPPPPHKSLKSRNSEMRFPAFLALKNRAILYHLKIPVVVIVLNFLFFIISFLFSLMKSKETAVRGPTGGGRPPVTGFY